MNESPFTSWPLTSCPSMNPDERPANESPLTLPLKFLLGFLCPSSFSSYLLPILQEDKHRKNKPWDYWKLLREIEFPGATRSDIEPFLIVCYHNYAGRAIICKEHQTPFRTSTLLSVLSRLPTTEVKSIWHMLKMGYSVNPAAQPKHTENILRALRLAVTYVQAGCLHSLRPQLSAMGCEESLWSKDPELEGLSTTCFLGICTAKRQTFKSSDN